MAFDDSGGLDERHRNVAESIATEKNLDELNLSSRMSRSFVNEDGEPNWDASDAVAVLEILDELMDDNPFVLADFS